jgi:iron complex outermembrane receptor protein
MKRPGGKGAGRTAADAESDGNEIVVTATKREQTLQDVPIAVSVATAKRSNARRSAISRTCRRWCPRCASPSGRSANTNFFIRGFGNGANNAGIEPSVGVFVDGVYRSRSAAQIADLPDVQRVEVLRGPQSTLFGKNAIAGVISIVTAEAEVRIRRQCRGVLRQLQRDGAQGPGHRAGVRYVAASLGGGYNKRDGYTRDPGWQAASTSATAGSCAARRCSSRATTFRSA